MQNYKVLLYYKYASIKDPDSLCKKQLDFCKQHEIRGRILISDEGINGTLAGKPAAVDAYIELTTQEPGLEEIEWKVSWADEQIFPRTRVVVRPEIVTLGLRKESMDVHLNNKAHYIEPEELLKLYESNDDFVILDARNIYEAKIGKFKNALIPPIDNFRDFPKFVKQNLKDYKDKPVVTYCTGGIRCEKASAYLREQGFQDVRQLHGGVHVYSEKTGGKYFEGELFVFDKRLHMEVNKVNPTVLTECEYCGQKLTRYIDCAKRENCRGLFVCCQECEAKYESVCSQCR